MQVSPFRKLLLKQIFSFTQAKSGGNLYTWGRISMGSGIDQESQDDQLIPRRVQDFNGNVVKVSTGLYSTAVLTTNGDLYTFGRNNHGQLGQGNREDQLTPSLVESFRQGGHKVVDVVMGAQHGIATTDDGAVWTWGFNGATKVPLWNQFFPAVNGLGVNAESDVLTPTRLEGLIGQSKPQSISAGFGFSLLHDEKDQLWGWGHGSDGQLGNGYQDHMQFPQLNSLWSDMSKYSHLKIKKMLSALSGSVALLNNGQLIGFGASINGQLGVREQEFVRSDSKNPVPMDVNKRYMRQTERVVDFDLSADLLIYYTNENNVYYSGNGRYYIPNLFYKGGDKKITKVVAAKNSFAFIVENGDVYASNDFIEPIEWKNYIDVARIPKEELFDGGKILDIGGTYDVRYAIVQN